MGGESAKQLRTVLEDSVAHHMVSDVPVGAFLSGGIDSGIITTLMQKVSGHKKISGLSRSKNHSGAKPDYNYRAFWFLE